MRIQLFLHVVPYNGRRGLHGLSFALPGRLQCVLRRATGIASVATESATRTAAAGTGAFRRHHLLSNYHSHPTPSLSCSVPGAR